MFATALGMLLPAVEHAGEDRFQSFGLEQVILQVADGNVVQLLHRHRHARKKRENECATTTSNGAGFDVPASIMLRWNSGGGRLVADAPGSTSVSTS